jgi:hypothetical protein
MDLLQDRIASFAKAIADDTKSARAICRNIADFRQKLEALKTVQFFVIHLRHPLLTNSRASLPVPMPGAINRTKSALDELLGVKNVDRRLALRFHSSLLDTYFRLIGRSDSFSDSILRAVPPTANRGPHRLVASFSLVDCDPQGVTYRARGKSFLQVSVANDVRRRLLGLDGDFRGWRNCRLLKLFFRVVNEEIYQKGDGDNEAAIEGAKETLEKHCFFTSREAFISSEAAKLVRSTSKKDVDLLFKRLFTGGKPRSHNEELSRAAQVLAMIQSVSIYAQVSSDEFAVYALKPRDPTNPFAHGVTLGGTDLSPDFVRRCRKLVDTLIEDINHKLVRRWKNISFSSRRIQDAVNPFKSRNAFQKEFALGGLNPDAFDCLAYIASRLLGDQHENNPLSFRIVTGTDETLRQSFEPVTQESGILGPHKGAAVPLLERDAIDNALLRIIAIIQGNYSFVQDESLYICFSYARQEWKLRYVARLHRRISQQLHSIERRPISRIDTIKAISRLAPNLLFAFLQSDATGFITWNGKLKAIGNKRSNPEWKTGPKKGRLKELSDLIKSQFNTPTAEQFLPILCEVIERIADTPGKGASFVIGKWNGKRGLKFRCQQMTPVFEMIKEWLISEIDSTVLYQAAIQDGAVVIGTDTNKIYCRRQLIVVDKGRPFDPEQWSPKNGKPPLATLWLRPTYNAYFWRESGKWYKWGTRHRSAAGLAYVGLGNFKVVCISSDTAVHVFDGQKVRVLRE